MSEGSSVAGLPSSQEGSDPIDLAMLEKVARAATPGPWKAELGGRDQWVWTDAHVANGGDVICDWPEDGGGGESRENWPANGTHIATFDPPTVLALLARIKELETRWQPIETAPRDGTRIVVLMGSRLKVMTAHWLTYQGRVPGDHSGWRDDHGHRLPYRQDLITHWMPLPEPPRDTSDRQDRTREDPSCGVS